MREPQRAGNEKWDVDGLPEFEMGIGVATDEVAAALLGSEERLDHSV
jgi:adenylate cyclase